VPTKHCRPRRPRPATGWFNCLRRWLQRADANCWIAGPTPWTQVSSRTAIWAAGLRSRAMPRHRPARPVRPQTNAGAIVHLRWAMSMDAATPSSASKRFQASSPI
jgi:hypothetical protein